MPLFTFTALDNKNKPIKKTVDAPDRSSVITLIKKQNLRPISIKLAKLKTKRSTFSDNFFTREKVKSDQLVMFTRQLSAMVGAGVPLLRALSALSTHITESPALKKILTSIIHDIESGIQLGDSLAKHPRVFDDVYVNMVRAGEAAGILDEILKRLAIQQEKSMSIRKKIKSSMSYPVVLLVITVLAFFGLMIFIIPQIGNVLTDLGGEDAKLPGLTLAMLAISSFIISYWYIIIIALGAIIYGILTFIRTPRGKHIFHRMLLITPIIQKIVKKIVIARFARTFSALIEAGVAVLEALSVTSRAVGNVIYEEALIEAEEAVKNGKSLSSVIEANDLFPPIVAQMLLVGEETGQTDKVLVKVAEFYEEEVDVAIGSLSTVIEPVVIVVMGSMVGLIAASVMLPIAGMAQNVS